MSEHPRTGLPPGIDTDRQMGTVATPIASLLDDQTLRWLGGERVRVEDYLAADSNLADNPEALLDLIYNEVRLREEQGEVPELDEYRRRFPALADMLRLQFEVHQAMQPGQLLDDISFSSDLSVPHAAPTRLPAINGYQILGEVGRGAMGVVYRARHVRLNRLVAIKMILAGPHAGPQQRARFETEARAVARLQHPHIVQIHEIGEQDGRPYFCLELVPGGSLAEKQSGRPLPATTAARLVETLARAVHRAHGEQIVHRDLKPANVLLMPSDAQRGLLLGQPGEEDFFEPKITDFGLARLLDREASDMPTTGGPVGTPPYMAPEQASPEYGSMAGTCCATDVYALGAILYEALTGRPPFLAATPFETLQQVKSLDPVPPRRLQPKVPRDLETICLACLRKSPDQRYKSALDLADDLRRFLDGKPIRQRPAAFWEPAVKWARRRPAAAAWVVLGAVALMSLAVTGVYYLQHRHEWARQHALERYQQIIRHRDEALFQGTLLLAVRMTPRERAVVDRNAIRTTARQALALAGVTIDDLAGPVLDPSLTSAEKADITTSCHELLILLSEAVFQPLAGQSPAEQRQEVDDGLRILDRAALLEGRTRAYHLHRYRLLLKRGELQGAAAERKRAEAIEPASASDHYFSGVLQYVDGKTDQAIHSFRQALRLQPNHFEAQCFLAICSLNAGRPGEAQIGLTACIGQRPHFVWAYLLRGLTHVQAGAFDDAEADFTAALDLDSGEDVRYALHVNRGLLWLQRGQVEKAVADLKTAVGLRPNDIPAHVNLAQAYRRQKQGKYAARELEVAIRLRPDFPAIYRTRAQIHLEGKDLEAALGDLDRTIELERPEESAQRADDHVERGRILHLLRRYQGAVREYDAALRLRPDHVRAHELRGEALFELNRLVEAEGAFGKCLEHGSASQAILRWRGATRLRLGDFSGAIDDYTQAMHFKDDSQTAIVADICARRGWAYFLSDAWKLAQADFEKALRLDAGSSDAQVGRGLCLVMLGDYRRAAADGEDLLRRQKPDTPEMMHNLGCLFAQAVARVKKDAGQADRATLDARYRLQAIGALRKTLLLVSAHERLAFWQEKMRPDSALDPIRTSAEFVELDRELRRKDPQTDRKNK
jgi:serine/threonine protein kinase/Tfp pilus assembly protein PilF